MKNRKMQTVTGLEWHEEVWPLEKLKKFERNPRKISKSQAGILRKAIEKLGYHHPIACQPDGTIISGHQRADALRDLGYTTLRVTVPNRALDAEEYKQMLIQTNLNNGDFDYQILADDFSVEQLGDWGMQADDLKRIPDGGNAGLTDPDEAPPLLINPLSVPGDIWQLGTHRLMCGSSTDADAVKALLAGVQPMLMPSRRCLREFNRC